MVTIKKEYLKILEIAAWVNRMMITLVYVWFGLLKILGTSPAEGLVTELFNTTLSGFMSSSQFVFSLGVFECFLGIIWLFPRLTKIAFYVLIFHLITTFMPIVFLPNTTWTSFFSLTLVGQYIMKNVVLFGSAFFVFSFSVPPVKLAVT